MEAQKTRFRVRRAVLFAPEGREDSKKVVEIGAIRWDRFGAPKSLRIAFRLSVQDWRSAGLQENSPRSKTTLE